MPTCFCTSFGCAAKGLVDPITKESQGREVDARTLKAHSLKDRTEAAVKARASSQRAIEAQEDDIAKYLGSLTLSAKASNSSPQHGSRLWSKSSESSDLDHHTQHISSLALEELAMRSKTDTSQPSRRTVIDNLLRRLAEIESSVTELSQNATAGLRQLQQDSMNLPRAFPLSHLLATCKSLVADLNGLQSKTDAFLEAKRPVEENLRNIMQMLRKAKLDCNGPQYKVPVVGVLETGLKYENGSLCSFIRTNSVTNNLCRSPFSPTAEEGRPDYPGLTPHASGMPFIFERRTPWLYFCVLNDAIYRPTCVDAIWTHTKSAGPKTHVRLPN